MRTAADHPFSPGGPPESTGTPTCAECGLPAVTPTSRHPGSPGPSAGPLARGIAVPSRHDHPNAAGGQGPRQGPTVHLHQG